MFLKLDSFLLDRVFQPATEWLIDEFDQTNFGAAIYLNWFAVAIMLSVPVASIMKISFIQMGVFSTVGDLYYCASVLRENVLARHYEERFRKGATMALNPLRVAIGVFGRILALFLIPCIAFVLGRHYFLLVHDMSLIVIGFGIAVNGVARYFLSCTPRPPRRKIHGLVPQHA